MVIKKARKTVKSRSVKKAVTKRPAAKSTTLPKLIYANASPHSLGETSMFDAGDQIDVDTVQNFQSDEDLIWRSVNLLQDAGFEVLGVTSMSINIAGTAKTYEKAFGTKLHTEERPVVKGGAEETTAEFIDTSDTDMPGLIATKGTSFEDVLEGVAIEEPVYFMAPSMFPPMVDYWHLDVPGDVSLGCNADRAHRAGYTGKGVKVAMVDSGWYKHPFFTNRGYRAAPVVLGPGASNPLNDESGHGTGESANIFSVAPDAQLLPVKINFANSKGAFDAAVALNPDIITCSWGSSNRFGPLSAANQALAASIAAAVASGITVIFSAGNGHWGFPGQHRDVISAGGVFMGPDGSMRASNYASGFMSNIYPGRRVPDLSGLVGMSPGATYIMLPLEPGDDIDVSKSGGSHPPGDETARNDGWAAFSGTSAAAPQLAGAAALVLQACSRLSPNEVRDILMITARDVTVGNCSPSTGANPATVGPDTATGNGLVNAQKAALVARLRCLGPIFPIRPIGPPIRPIQPIRPIRPIRPIQPIRPIGPIRPPIFPIRRVSERSEEAGGEEEAVEALAQTESVLSQEELESLEQMAIRSELDLDDI
jgi:subtilisin family serine protease